MASGETTLLRQPKFAADTSPYVTEQVFYRSKDGTRMPMFIVHRRDMKRDGSQPGAGCTAMAASIFPSRPGFRRAPWRGWRWAASSPWRTCAAVANTAPQWHKAGVREHKQNVFDDFIAAARVPGA